MVGEIRWDEFYTAHSATTMNLVRVAKRGLLFSALEQTIATADKGFGGVKPTLSRPLSLAGFDLIAVGRF
jgi:hypothetical protein